MSGPRPVRPEFPGHGSGRLRGAVRACLVAIGVVAVAGLALTVVGVVAGVVGGGGVTATSLTPPAWLQVTVVVGLLAAVAGPAFVLARRWRAAGPELASGLRTATLAFAVVVGLGSVATVLLVVPLVTLVLAVVLVATAALAR